MTTGRNVAEVENPTSQGQEMQEPTCELFCSFQIQKKFCMADSNDAHSPWSQNIGVN